VSAAGRRRDGSALGPREQAFVLLGLAYSASIGGIGTLVGSPPNAIAAAEASISFAGWLRIGLPLVVVLFPLMQPTLCVLLRPSRAAASRRRHCGSNGLESVRPPWASSR